MKADERERLEEIEQQKKDMLRRRAVFSRPDAQACLVEILVILKWGSVLETEEDRILYNAGVEIMAGFGDPETGALWSLAEQARAIIEGRGI